MAHKTKIAGILNITPDSFSDGGLAGNVPAIISAAQKLIDDGADVIDIGAESTRPGARTLTPDEEWQRLEPCLAQICALAKKHGVLCSIDTRNVATAQKAIECGIDWVNDVSGAGDAAMLEVLKTWGGKVVIMHNLGVPADKNIVIDADKNVVDEVYRWLEARLNLLEKDGIARSRVIIDPGIGFGKNAAQSWDLVNNIAAFKKLGAEILVGHSRKSFLSERHCDKSNEVSAKKQSILPCSVNTGLPRYTPDGRFLAMTDKDAATLEVSKQLAAQAVDYLRVHDVSLHKTGLKL